MAISRENLELSERVFQEKAGISLEAFLDVLSTDTIGRRQLDSVIVSPNATVINLQVRGLNANNEALWTLPIDFDVLNKIAVDRSTHILVAPVERQSGTTLLKNMRDACQILGVKRMMTHLVGNRSVVYAKAGFLPISAAWPAIHRRLNDRFEGISESWSQKSREIIRNAIRFKDINLFWSLAYVDNTGEDQNIGSLFPAECRELLFEIDWQGGIDFNEPESARRFHNATNR